jgi:DNA modification methylase
MDRATTGWSDCNHGTWRPGRILDPFVGSGTTLEVATGMGREAVGIDIDERNADLARQRVGMFLDVVQATEEVPA